MEPREIDPLNNPGFDHPREQGWGGAAPGPRRPSEEPGDGPVEEADDQVVLHRPTHTTLALLRERVLEATRRALGVPRDSQTPVFAAGTHPSAEQVLGRILSEQNLLASRRRGDWSLKRIDAALEEGMVSGTAETLEVLDELGELDAQSWGLVCAVLHAFHRKVEEAARALSPR